MSDKPDWESFGMAVMHNWPTGDVDGFELQELAEKYRIITPVIGGFKPSLHEDEFGISPEKGDSWYQRNYLE